MIVSLSKVPKRVASGKTGDDANWWSITVGPIGALLWAGNGQEGVTNWYSQQAKDPHRGHPRTPTTTRKPRGGNGKALPDGLGKSDFGPDRMVRDRNQRLGYLSSISLVSYRTYSDSETISYTTSHVASGNARDDPPDIDQILLRRTQQYLYDRSAGRTPTGPLRDAWEWFYETYNPLVLEVVRKSCPSDSDVVDCVQEIWTTIVCSMAESKYDPRQGRFCRWLSRLARNRVIDFVRAASRGPNVALADLPPVACGRNLQPHEALERQETRQLVRRVLRLLEAHTSAPNCHIIRGMWLRGDAVSEIADELGLTPQQVWYRHRRTKVRLKRLLEANGLGIEGLSAT